MTAENLWEFHHSAGEGDKNTALIMDRAVVKTQSITQVTVSEGNSQMLYKDLQKEIISKKTFPRD
jgi:hypothetical protein